MPSRSTPLSKIINPETLGDYIKSKTHMNVMDVKVVPFGGSGAKVTVSVYENKPVNRTRTLEVAATSMAGAFEGFLGTPVGAEVSLDMGNPMFDPTEGWAIYKILFDTNASNVGVERNASARRVAERFMALAAAEETVMTLNVKGSRVSFSLKGPRYQKVEEIQRVVHTFLVGSKAIYLDVSPVRQAPGESTGSFALISTAGPVYGEVNRRITQGALKAMGRESVSKKWCDRILMGDGDDVTALLSS